MCDNIHRKAHPNATMAYQQGIKGNRVLFVFESPGKNEHELNRPVVGKTGVHLCMFCEEIRAKVTRSSNASVQDIGQDFCKCNVSILNVVDDWMPKKETGEFKTAHQLNREERQLIARQLIKRWEFKRLLRYANVVICFGRLAWDMGNVIEAEIKHFRRDYNIFYTYHLSGRASKKFKGTTWSKKMKQLAKKVITALEHKRKVRDFTKFKKNYKQIDASTVSKE